MPQINKVVIIGAGPAGLAAALRLHDINNISVTIYEIREQPTHLGGAINIPANGLRLIDRLGVYESLLKGGSIIPQLVVHSINGNELGRLDYIAKIKAKTGYEFIRIKRTVVVDALLSEVQNRGIPIHFNKSLVAVDENAKTGATITFSDGSSDTADLLLGCDGIHSAVRKLHVDPKIRPEYSGVSSMSSIVPMPTELAGMHTTFTSQGSVVVVPCAENSQEKSLFWFLTRHIPEPDTADKRDGWNEHREKEVAGFKNTLEEVTSEVGGDWGSFLRAVVSKTDTVNFYPIYRLPHGGVWHTSRCVLIGDAAHAMQPHVGQGVSMALEDVFLLSRLLKKESSLQESLRQFETVRRPRIEEFASQAANNGNRARQKGPWQMAITEWGMWAWFRARRVFSSWSWGFREEEWTYDIDRVDIDYFDAL
ncbi:salicylate hydroxylase [Aspergillus ruber CBS 135680]|uniref:Salicylate hydroxylase n=1 Tax=Aspergillus ruber (strain CBS 135680) TaxID=1388766 RepID=A0A017SR43_ASPRC|nr:salicylate hydroxylase [Aspergillus ruber CBS 135680]EYE98750.1 salicylate hydroxylase [Aspergillus ruber CBS 135680]